MQELVPAWVRWWLFLSAFLVLWDAGYIFLRPHSMPGGALFPLWKPYKLYATVDLIYSDERWQSGDRFCEAQALCNLVEVSLQFLGLHLLRKGRSHHAAAALLLFITQAFTFWKTTLYWLYDILGGFANTGHNPHMTLIFIYVIPNVLWIVFPLLVVVEVGSRLLAALGGVPSGDRKAKAL